ncbi:hypothetical protein NBRC13296_12615 [Paenibacillus chitinolyticus]|uniref:hypothetical protein n=1 Tax=Paenibacillus chitinolyticus TaxID=79263 RepID=UPI003556762C
MIKIQEILPLGTTTIGNIKIFDVRLKFTDGSTRLWELTIEPQLKKLGCPVTRLSETKKLKEWILGEGRSFFEESVNRR